MDNKLYAREGIEQTPGVVAGGMYGICQRNFANSINAHLNHSRVNGSPHNIIIMMIVVFISSIGIQRGTD